MIKELLWSERILIVSGLGILLSVPLIFYWGSFEVWIVAKLLYASGALLFLFSK